MKLSNMHRGSGPVRNVSRYSISPAFPSGPQLPTHSLTLNTQVLIYSLIRVPFLFNITHFLEKGWKCPTCRHSHTKVPEKYKCFCGEVSKIARNISENDELYIVFTVHCVRDRFHTSLSTGLAMDSSRFSLYFSSLELCPLLPWISSKR